MATQASYDGSTYTAAFGEPLSQRLQELVELRLSSRRRGPDPLDELLAAAPSNVVSWMRRKARLADGTRPGLPLCDAASVGEAIEHGRETHGTWSIQRGSQELDAWAQVHAGLLTELCGLAAPEAAHLLSCSQSGFYKLRERHRMWVRDERDYANRVGEVALEALRRSGL